MVYKVRSKILGKGGIAVGATGTHIKKMLTGVVTACVPVVNASSVASASMSIASASAGDKIFLSGSDADHGIYVYAVSCSADAEVTASYGNNGAQSSASEMTFHYMVIGT